LASERVSELFAEYADAFARGERPRAAEYVDRAGAEGDALAAMIDRFLRSAPRPQATTEDSVLLASMLQREPPLLELRRRRGLKLDELVDRLLSGLTLKPASRAALRTAYHQLETGLLDPDGVDGRVWAVLAKTLRGDVRELARWRPPPVAAAPAFRDLAERALEEPIGISQDQRAASDDVDRLFRAVS